MDCAIYRAGTRTDVDGDISDALDLALSDDNEAFCWIGLHEPTRAEFDLVSAELGLHPLAVDDAVEAHQTPKVERYGDVTFVVCKTLALDEERVDVEVGEIMVFVGPNFVITVRHGQANPLSGVRRRLEADPLTLLLGPAAVAQAVLGAVVDTHIRVATRMRAVANELEDRVFSATRDSSIAEDVYHLKREVVEAHAAIGPMVLVMRALTSDGTQMAADAIPFLRDVADRARQAAVWIDGLNELLPQVLSAHLARVSVQQNDDMRRITAWAAIIAVPTLIAGIYGMNFDVMPELRFKWGYPLVIMVMLAICATLFTVFRKSRWL
ncbi:magnesium and cobalt transport protein CorA [Marinactinospora thermotolerans]|uniref:Magnesium transporter n=1 Tax=Marinactinospora thermotolerans DSM 45154 TaxID=1122192 RepID=A0A1T4T2L6_9ACTN|nr:magnesium and cobalt transport protein CorA [Marinactinospora thermotolerans]SKA34754.1 magnesium transporter [Marinactinospora thermotolerans DSM 45154]